MTKRGWWARINAALPWLLVVSIAVLGPRIVGDAFGDRSIGHWCLFVLWLFALAGGAWAINAGRGKAGTGALIPPAEVPAAAVTAAIAATHSRVAAVKALRQGHPGLGLKDAVHLVDEARS